MDETRTKQALELLEYIKKIKGMIKDDMELEKIVKVKEVLDGKEIRGVKNEEGV